VVNTDILTNHDLGIPGYTGTLILSAGNNEPIMFYVKDSQGTTQVRVIRAILGPNPYQQQ
jgi:hypothetical protein